MTFFFPLSSCIPICCFFFKIFWFILVGMKNWHFTCTHGLKSLLYIWCLTLFSFKRNFLAWNLTIFLVNRKKIKKEKIIKYKKKKPKLPFSFLSLGLAIFILLPSSTRVNLFFCFLFPLFCLCDYGSCKLVCLQRWSGWPSFTKSFGLCLWSWGWL